MSVITFRNKGDFSKTDKFFGQILHIVTKNSIFDKYGKKGVELLKQATPVDTGNTANSWSYDIDIKKNSTIITWNNSNINDGVNVAILLQYGHGTRNGGYYSGADYINPSIQRVFEQMAKEIWEELESV